MNLKLNTIIKEKIKIGKAKNTESFSIYKIYFHWGRLCVGDIDITPTSNNYVSTVQGLMHASQDAGEMFSRYNTCMFRLRADSALSNKE